MTNDSEKQSMDTEVQPVDAVTTESNETNNPQPDKKRKAELMALELKKEKPFTVKGDPVAIPGINDVLMGRGKGIADHQGNLNFRTFVREKKEEYTTNSWK
jgi:hypothetical protein